MPIEEERSYYAARAQTAFALAKRAACDESRDIHTEMARLYEGLARGYWKLPADSARDT
jgi:hypothetical protein